MQEWNRKLVYLHKNETGSSWVANVIQEIRVTETLEGGNHTNYLKNIKSYLKFSVQFIPNSWQFFICFTLETINKKTDCITIVTMNKNCQLYMFYSKSYTMLMLAKLPFYNNVYFEVINASNVHYCLGNKNIVKC